MSLAAGKEAISGRKSYQVKLYIISILSFSRWVIGDIRDASCSSFNLVNPDRFQLSASPSGRLGDR